jgi:sodium-dependent phosphate cotransporter
MPSDGTALGDGLSARPGVTAQAAMPLRMSHVIGRGGRWRLAGGLLRAAYAAGALMLFILALEVLKTGAAGVADILTGASAQGAANILGFGWLGAYGALSGSPVAAIALSLFAGDVISDREAFAMLNGSRLGASFVVLLVGFLYYLGKRRSADGIFIGVVTMLTTFTIYAPVVPLGSFVLERGWLDGVEASAPGFLVSFTEVAFQPLAEEAADNLPLLLVFAGGIGLLLASFAIFDRALPNLEQPSLRVERLSRLLHHPLVMFVLGLLITTMTLSVSISVTLLIPLSLKGYVRREGIIPYVMGANISTWVDTMFAALLLDSPRAFTIVFTQMATGATLSLIVLLFLYRPYSRIILQIAHGVTRQRRQFALFLGAIFLVPLVLFFL